MKNNIVASLLEQVWTGNRGEASREPRPARPRAVRAATSVGAKFSAGPPQGKLAPSGGSVVREATSVGAKFSAGPPQGKLAPEGLEPAAPNLLEQVWTGNRGEASREPRPARPRAVRAATSLGAKFSAGPPQGKLAPSGGSVVHAVTSVGAKFSAGPPQGKLAPSGGSAVRAATSVGAIP